MIDRLYVARGNQTSGPFSAAQLKGFAAAGRIRATDTVWREGAIDKSVDAAKVKNLFPSLPAPPHGEGGDGSRPPTPVPPALLDSPPSLEIPAEIRSEPALA